MVVCGQRLTILACEDWAVPGQDCHCRRVLVNYDYDDYDDSDDYDKQIGGKFDDTISAVCQGGDGDKIMVTLSFEN